MQFKAREDIEAPIGDVFRAVSNFEGWERAVLRRGAQVSRTDNLEQPGKGMTWAVDFSFRNRQRQAALELLAYEAPNKLRVAGKTGGLESDFDIELVALSRERTRMEISANLKPTTVSARLLVQPLKLARSKLSNRFRQRIADFAGTIEADIYPGRR